MKGSSMELAKVSKKMHWRVFDGENIDLIQVMKDVDENFALIYKATVSQYENLDRKFQIYNYYPDVFELRKALGFFIPPFRCLLKRCVEEGGAMNHDLIEVLTYVESNFVKLHEFCTTQLSREELGYVQWKDLEIKVSCFVEGNVMASQFIKAMAAVFSVESSKPLTSFINSKESTVELLDQVLENLNEFDMEDKNIKTSIEKLEFLRNYLQFKIENWISGEGLKEFLISVEVLAENAGYYSFVKKCGNLNRQKEYLPSKIRVDSEMGIAVLKHLELKLLDSNDLPPMTDELLKGYVGFVQVNLTKLFSDDESLGLTKQVKNQLEYLHKELEFLMVLVLNCLPKNEDETEILSDIRRRFQTLVGNVAYALFFFLENQEMTGISDFLEKAHLLKGRIIHIFLPIASGRNAQNSTLLVSFQEINKKTETIQLLDFLIDYLKELKDSTFHLKTYESGGFQNIHVDLDLLRSYLSLLRPKKRTASEDLLTRVRCAADEAEHFIYSYVAGAIPDWYRSLWFSSFRLQVNLITESYSDDWRAACEKISAHDINNIDIVASSNNPRTDVVVGLEAEVKLMKERLICDLRRKLDVVSIVGMAGVGKTTFAKKVYDDPFIVEHFQFRAWCCVSQEYDKKELMLMILASVTKLDADVCSEGELSLMLHKQLTGRRYLIVMDDIWGMDALKDLKRFFPDNSNGSRIMLTSRNRLEDYGDPLELRLLTHEESWELLKQKVYHENKCPLQLCQVGEEIAQKCSGLPLAIIVVAGILLKSDKKLDFWEGVAEI